MRSLLRIGYILQITYFKTFVFVKALLYRISNLKYFLSEWWIIIASKIALSDRCFQSMENRVLFIVVSLNAFNESFDGLCFKLFENYHLINMILGHSDWFYFYQKFRHRYHPIKWQNLTFLINILYTRNYTVQILSITDLDIYHLVHKVKWHW